MNNYQRKTYYDEFLKSLHKQFFLQLETIKAHHNFELGEEFEISMCIILANFLPIKYGICRGYVVNSDGDKQGDDIIIYDQERFPTLRLLPKGDYSRLENIPVEAVYVYIECKHTLDIYLNDDEKCVFQKAFQQCFEVKRLINTRENVPYTSIDPYLELPLRAEILPGFPQIRNPAFAIILARNVAQNGSRLKNKNDIYEALKAAIEKTKRHPNSVDLIIAGHSNFISPKVNLEGIDYSVPFYCGETLMNYSHHLTEMSSYGYFLSTLGYVLDYIRLGKMPWLAMLNNPYVK